MSESVKLFQTVRKFYVEVGIHQTSLPNRKFHLNFRNFFFLFSKLIMFTSICAYVLFQANSFDEYFLDFCAAVTYFNSIINHCLQIEKITKILELIRKFEGFIERSKIGMGWNSIASNFISFSAFSLVVGSKYKWASSTSYSDLNAKIERFCYLFYVITIKYSFIAISVPPLIKTLAESIKENDSDAETYHLPVPAMYVNDFFGKSWIGTHLTEAMFPFFQVPIQSANANRICGWIVFSQCRNVFDFSLLGSERVCFNRR